MTRASRIIIGCGAALPAVAVGFAALGGRSTAFGLAGVLGAAGAIAVFALLVLGSSVSMWFCGREVWRAEWLSDGRRLGWLLLLLVAIVIVLPLTWYFTIWRSWNARASELEVASPSAIGRKVMEALDGVLP